uniref:Galacturonokinase n=1 Tax=Araucaria cunninghamii TaxID=56994 RepID=A0A0D6R1A9_ARACU
MAESSWPSAAEVERVRRSTASLAGCDVEDVRVVASPYRICPLGAHIDHQGGTVTAMTINKGVLLGFVPSGDCKVVLRSAQFKGEVQFRIDNNLCKGDGEVQEECGWGRYPRGAIFALKSAGKSLYQGIVGSVVGSGPFDSSGISSSAAVGVAYLLAFESANDLNISPSENIELDRLIENGFLGLKNGILDQSAILLSQYKCLTCIDCKSKEYKWIHPPKSNENSECEELELYKILLAFSGVKHSLSSRPGYNSRVAECQMAARILLEACGKPSAEPLLCNVTQEDYILHKDRLEGGLARRAEHYFSENKRVFAGLKAWSEGKLQEFGKLMSESGLSSIQNYECGCEPMIELYEILLKAPGVFGARFSGAGFRGCCVALVDANLAEKAALYVREQYKKVQPDLAANLEDDGSVLICESGESARLV